MRNRAPFKPGGLWTMVMYDDYASVGNLADGATIPRPNTALIHWLRTTTGNQYHCKQEPMQLVRLASPLTQQLHHQFADRPAALLPQLTSEGGSIEVPSPLDVRQQRAENEREERNGLRSGEKERSYGGEERAILGGDRYAPRWSFRTDTNLIYGRASRR